MQYCTFYLNQLLFGIEISKVQEILFSQKLTPIPLASDTISGLLNLRGQILVAIDLRKRMGMKSTTQNLSANLILKNNEELISLLVEDVGDIVETESTKIEPPPRHLKGTLLNFIFGVYPLKKSLLLILDPEKIVDWKNV